MLTYLRKHKAGIAAMFSLFLCAVLMVFVLTINGQFQSMVSDKVSSDAQTIGSQTNSILLRVMSYYEKNATYASDLIVNSESVDSFQNSIRALMDDSRLSSVQQFLYIKNDTLYTSDFVPVSNMEDYGNLQQVATASGAESAGTFGVVNDKLKNANFAVFYNRIVGNPNIDAIVLCYYDTVLTNELIDEKTTKTSTAEYVVLCESNGRIIAPLYPAEDKDGVMKIYSGGNLLDEIETSGMNSKSANKIKNCITSKKADNKTFTVTLGGVKYILAVQHNGPCPSLCVVSLFQTIALDNNSNKVLSSVASCLVILIFAVLFMALLLFLVKKFGDRQAKEVGRYNNDLKLPTRKGTEELIQKNLERFSGSTFAVVAVRLKHYIYLKEKFPEKIDDIILKIKTYLNSSLELGDLLGAAGDGEFILLYHYGEIRVVSERLKRVAAAVAKTVGTKEYTINLDFGVYPLPSGEKVNINRAVTNAFQTIDADKDSSSMSNVRLYNEVFKDNYMQSAEIELKMEFALKNDEFKVFFQPKIDALTGKIDSCEALVRWYDAEKEFYRTPNMFLPLFEQNGFIVKLDRYVFYKACEFIGLRIADNQPVYPTSVNISRITALSDGFMEYYASVKHKFNIPDNFITLEFTESIASASYETLNSIARALHNNKFLCSIDDYGSGYSSLNILKNINVDEVKMDRLFLDKGISADRDRVIQTCIVSLANKLGIKVVQEGVETAEQLEYVKESGCHIIQGYYYSKPLSMLEYIQFIEKKLHIPEVSDLID